MKKDSAPPNLYFDKGTKRGEIEIKEKERTKKIMSWINLLVSSPSADPVPTHRSLKARKGGEKEDCVYSPSIQPELCGVPV